MKAWLGVGAAVAALAAAGVLAARLAVIPVPPAPPSSAAQAQAAWGRVLARFVNAQGEVDFEALSRDRADLDRSLRYVADTPLDSLTDVNERLAHMINAYNALSMFNVIDRGIPQSHAGANKIVNFLLRRLHIGGRVMSLYSFENELIRPLSRRMGDPRVHFALNCSARSCPALPQAPFTAARLDAQLERETRAFFARPQNFRIDTATRRVWLSEILSFYSEDFVPAHGRTLIEYVNRYAPQAAELDSVVRFTPYDWTIATSSDPSAARRSAPSEVPVLSRRDHSVVFGHQGHIGSGPHRRSHSRASRPSSGVSRVRVYASAAFLSASAWVG